jgi:DNA-binding CsgD family transcriptional regulator
LLPLAEQQLARAQADHALATASSAVAIGERFADADLIALARHLQGRGLICSRQIEEGLAHLDEAMLAVVGGLVSPLATGLVYCSVLEACRQVYAFDRAREWTTALARWCEGQPQMVAFTGACRVHRAEVMQLNGDWPAAFSEARRACERPAPDGGRAPPGAAFYQQGEVHRLRGAWSAAEEAFRLASRYGCEPQPGLALLRLGEGRSDAAVAMIRRLVQGAVGPDRLRLLPAAVQILAAAGMAGAARQASEELDALAAGLAKGALAAMAAHADGIVALVEGRPESALVSLRRALAQWQAVAAPYEEARVRLLLGRACDLLGDCDGRDLELQAARETFEALGALPDIVRIESMCAAAAPPALRSAHRLSRRELQVLRLVATGKTNKAIGQQLGLSERTIDRHVGNILDKLDVQSRAAATAYAYEHALIAPSPE